MSIDLDRGVTIRIETSGVRVYMYKDTPGIYYNHGGHVISEKIAAAAGFPVDELRHMKEMRDKQSDALNAIEREFLGQPVTEIANVEGWKIMHLGVGRHSVLDPDGNSMNTRDMTQEEALILLEQLTGVAVRTPSPLYEVPGELEPVEVKPLEPPHYAAISKGFGHFGVYDQHGNRVDEEKGWLTKERALELAIEANAAVV